MLTKVNRRNFYDLMRKIYEDNVIFLLRENSRIWSKLIQAQDF